MKQMINWAVVGTGGISNAFTTGLQNAEGAVLYAAVSRKQESAEAFSNQYGFKKAYNDYDAMLADPAVDIIYLGLPNALHKPYALAAFRAGKPVLCEKPMAMCASDLEEMIVSAREHRVFFMEAMWARFTAAETTAAAWLAEGRIGDVKRFQGNTGWLNPYDPANRLWRPDLGGGILLDCGVYPLALASLVFKGTEPDKIVSILQMYEGVDRDASLLLHYAPDKIAAINASLSVNVPGEALIYGTKGRIRIPDCVFVKRASLEIDGKEPIHFGPEAGQSEWIKGNGYNYIAEAVMDDLRAGRTENARYPLAESLGICKIMDAVRHQNDFWYPGEKQ